MLSRRLKIVISAFMILPLLGCVPAARTADAVISDASRNTSNTIIDVSALDKDGYCTCDYNGVKRKYILYIPEEAKKNAPLVFMLHGYASNPKSFIDLSGMNDAAKKYGYAVVYPQGIRNENSTNGACWNSGLTSSGNDDIGFLTALAKYLQQTYGFNNKETFAVGFSNGAFMMYKLACEVPETFRAVASVAGSMSGGAWDERKASSTVGILQINGTQDGAVPLDGSMSSSGGYGGAPDIKGVIEYWKNAEGLNESKKAELSGKATAYEYSNGSNDNLVWYIEIEGGTHAWPRESTAGINTSEVILGFFSHFVK